MARPAGSGVGGAIALASPRLPADGVANVLLLPSIVLLIGYWTSGLLFVRPMPRLERALVALDARLRIQAIAACCPRTVAELLEFSYSGIYADVVIALVIAVHCREGRGCRGAENGRYANSQTALIFPIVRSATSASRTWASAVRRCLVRVHLVLHFRRRHAVHHSLATETRGRARAGAG
ncbi:MAG TPA: hypothetical protein VEO74_11010 [Thermoanaerobaculia bacterium]|nr:hypothetical protein [Thermoanaerobaculia bacterium]